MSQVRAIRLWGPEDYIIECNFNEIHRFIAQLRNIDTCCFRNEEIRSLLFQRSLKLIVHLIFYILSENHKLTLLYCHQARSPTVTTVAY